MLAVFAKKMDYLKMFASVTQASLSADFKVLLSSSLLIHHSVPPLAHCREQPCASEDLPANCMLNI